MKHSVADNSEKHEEQKHQELVVHDIAHDIRFLVVVQHFHAPFHLHSTKKDFMKGKHLFQILS